jgi:acetyl esterase/lipase
MLLGLCVGCGSLHGAQNAVLRDPVSRDSRFPAGATGLTIESHGALMNALVYNAAGEGPHPTLVLLHGFPGNERNLDIAQAVRRAGWNVVFFHYRGAWGSEGDFSFSNALEDVPAVVDWVASDAFSKPWRADSTRIALLGHSMRRGLTNGSRRRQCHGSVHRTSSSCQIA